MNAERKVPIKETAGKGLEYGGIIGAIIGIATLNPEIVLFSAAGWLGGKSLRGKNK